MILEQFGLERITAFLNIGQIKPITDLSKVERTVYEMVKRSGIFLNTIVSKNL